MKGVLLLTTNVLFALCLCIACTDEVHAQQELRGQSPCMGGTLYYVTFPDSVTNEVRGQPPSPIDNKFYLMVYSPVDDNLVKAGRVNGPTESRSLLGGTFEIWDVTERAPITTQLNTPAQRVYTIEAESPVIVYAFMVTEFGSCAFTPLPVEEWGTEYFVAGFPGEIVSDITPLPRSNFSAEPREAPAEFIIIARYDDTEVVIEPTDDVYGCPGCSTLTIQLDAGESYLVQSLVDTSDRVNARPEGDIAGTFISSNKQIGVLSGNTRLSHISAREPGLTDNSFKDLAIEWLTPVSKHGTEFVYLPTWDDRRLQPQLPFEESRMGEVVRLYGTSRLGDQITEVEWRNAIGQLVAATNPSLGVGEFTHEEQSFPAARVYTTSKPSMAMMSPYTARTFVPGLDNQQRIQFDSRSTYMVELIPRERWGSFAPFIGLGYPAGTKDYVNVVTDTHSIGKIFYKLSNTPRRPFVFNRGTIPGTDLIWGSVQIQPGVEYTLEGDGGARFSGHVYGFREGFELYESGIGVEYEEEIALSYGYPLASMNSAAMEPDSLEILMEEGEKCGEYELTIRTLNPNPSGIQSVEFVPGSDENARIEFITPGDPAELLREIVTFVKVKVVPVRYGERVSGVILVNTASCGNQGWTINYHGDPDVLEVSSGNEGLDFGSVNVGLESDTMCFVVKNNGDRSISLRTLEFDRGGDERFEIVNVIPAFDWSDPDDILDLGARDSLVVCCRAKRSMQADAYSTVLNIDIGCLRPTAALKVEIVDTISSVTESGKGEEPMFIECTPNPVTGDATLTYTVVESIFTEIDLYSSDGLRVRRLFQGNAERGTHSISFSTINLASGEYFVEIRSKAWHATQRIMIIH